MSCSIFMINNQKVLRLTVLHTATNDYTFVRFFIWVFFSSFFLAWKSIFFIIVLHLTFYIRYIYYVILYILYIHFCSFFFITQVKEQKFNDIFLLTPSLKLGIAFCDNYLSKFNLNSKAKVSLVFTIPRLFYELLRNFAQ